MHYALQVGIRFWHLNVHLVNSTCLTSVLDKESSKLLSSAAILCVDPINMKSFSN